MGKRSPAPNPPYTRCRAKPLPPASKNSFAVRRTRPACSTTTTLAPCPLATTIASSLHVQAVRPMALRPGAVVRLASNASRTLPVRWRASTLTSEPGER